MQDDELITAFDCAEQALMEYEQETKCEHSHRRVSARIAARPRINFQALASSGREQRPSSNSLDMEDKETREIIDTVKTMLSNRDSWHEAQQHKDRHHGLNENGAGPASAGREQWQDMVEKSKGTKRSRE